MKGEIKMGDRGNIEMIYESGEKIYFYSHWGGSDLTDVLRKALERGKDRWGDEPYLARIIFCEMIQDDVMDLTGYGISPYICDSEHPIISVCCSNLTIEIEGKKWSFEDFIK